jgi:hypothetical protein
VNDGHLSRIAVGQTIASHCSCIAQGAADRFCVVLDQSVVIGGASVQALFKLEICRPTYPGFP